jgi:hypothetical protein
MKQPEEDQSCSCSGCISSYPSTASRICERDESLAAGASADAGAVVKT